MIILDIRGPARLTNGVNSPKEYDCRGQRSPSTSTPDPDIINAQLDDDERYLDLGVGLASACFRSDLCLKRAGALEATGICQWLV